MDGSADREAVVQQVEEIVQLWETYDNTGDFSHVTDADVIAEDIVHSHPGNPPLEGKDAFLEFFESHDVSDYEWTNELDDVTIGRDLVIARITFRGIKPADDDHETEKVVGTSVDAFRRQPDGSLKQFLSIPNSNG